MAADSTSRFAGFPPQIKYIVGNEAAERFSYYGMTAILTMVMVNYLGFEDADAEWTFHIFSSAVYFTPLLGGYISDRFLGKYHTIISFSFFYVAGHAVLAAWETKQGLYVGLGLIAFGAGGIKPCVSAHVGDQFTQANKHLLPKVFGLFYWSINLGSFCATLLTPYVRANFGPSAAFGIPGVLMVLALAVFWMGRKLYIYIPPTGKRDDTPGKVLFHLLVRGAARTRERFGEGKLDEALAVVRVAKILLPVAVFWALFFQTGSSWVLLTADLDGHGVVQPDQLQAFNPGLVMVLIPLFTGILYPAFERRGVAVTALRRMTLGMFVTALSFVAVAAVAAAADVPAAIEGSPLGPCADLSVFWMVVPYAILTSGEILVSVTGLEFAYTQAPRSVKSTIMSVWYLTFAGGNLLTAVVAKAQLTDSRATQFLYWAGLMTATACLFWLFATTYKVVEYVEDDDG